MSGLAHTLKSACGVAVLSAVFILSLLVSTQAQTQTTNSAPVISNIPNPEIVNGVTFMYNVIANDADGDPLTYSLYGGSLTKNEADTYGISTFSNLLTGTGNTPSIDSATGVITWTSPTTFETNKWYAVYVTDGTNGDNFAFGFSFSNTDTNPPVIGTIPTLAATTSTAFSFDVGAITTDASGSGGTLSYSLSGGPPSGAEIDGTTGVFTWTPTASQVATHTFDVSVTDGTSTDSESITITVTNPPPVLDTIDDQSVTALELLTFTATATDANSDTLSYSLTGNPPSGAVIGETSGIFTWTPTDTQLGVHTFDVTVTTATDSATASQTFTVTVRPLGLSQENIQKLNEAIAPRLVQSAVASTIASLGNRIDIAFSGLPQTASYQLDGQNIQLDGKTSLSEHLQDTLLQKLPSHARSLADGTMDWKHALGNSSFALPFNATDGAGDGTGSNLAVWGSADYSKLSGDGDVDWDGDVVSVQLGVDNRVRDVLVGGMVSWSKGETDYTQNAQKGEYTHTITSIHPYLAWSSAGINLWSSVGYGQGKLELKEETRTTETDTKLLSLAAGVKGAIPDKPGFSIKSDIALVRVDIDARDNIIAEQRIDSQRLRVLLEYEEEHRATSGGGVFKPVVELGLRYDGGDGDTGVGALLGAGVRYTNASGLSAQGKLHTLIGRNDYKEWGISGVIRQQTGVGGRGLAFSLRPSYGTSNPSDNTAAGSTDTLWEQNQSADSQGATDYSMRMNADISYGLSAPGGRGLLIPYSEATLGDVNRYRLGLRWKRHSWLDINLFGEEQAGKHTVLLESRIWF